jgi:hypothetical protein
VAASTSRSMLMKVDYTRKDDVEAEGLGGRSQAQFCPVNW